ncbi:hypothetical protein C8J56DRAFT_901555 [Mycena floridula]|nr:hypothetical protein C8J56DRAFT_901555 [Mycena floridula]
MSQIVFVTGATGFLGSHIISQLLAAGYRVRAAVRPSKVDQIRAVYAKYGQNVEVVGVADIVADQFPEALKGVYAVIHTASPIFEKASTEEMLNARTLNVLRQGEKAGIQRYVVTSSIATVSNPRNSFTDKDWSPVTREEAVQHGGLTAYRASKSLAEKALWEFADAHPNVDVTTCSSTVNPPFMYGPFAEEFQIEPANYYAMSTNLYIYRLISPNGPFPVTPRWIDVRDIAKVHVLALKSPLTSETDIGKKRLIIGSLEPLEYAPALALIKEKYPELAERITKTPLPNIDIKTNRTLFLLPFDVQRVADVVGFKKEDYTGIESCLLGAIDSILAIEKTWVEKGHSIDVPKL